MPVSIAAARRASQEVRLVAPIKPASVYAYPDALTIWVKRPVRGKLARQAKHVLNGPDPFGRGYRQRLQFAQPSAATLRALAKLRDAYLNYVEISLDWVFDTAAERDDAFAFIDRHHVKKNHREQGLRHVKGETRYTGARSVPNNFVVYGDRPCRVDGSPFSVHHDWRIRGRAAVQRAGFAEVADLLTLDFGQFWQERLLFAGVDLQKLGRMHRRAFNPATTQRSWVTASHSGRFHYDGDAATGAILFTICDHSIQKLIDRFGSRFRVRDCLIPIDVRHLIAPPQSASLLLYDRWEQVTATPANPLSHRQNPEKSYSRTVRRPERHNSLADHAVIHARTSV